MDFIKSQIMRPRVLAPVYVVYFLGAILVASCATRSESTPAKPAAELSYIHGWASSSTNASQLAELCWFWGGTELHIDRTGTIAHDDIVFADKHSTDDFAMRCTFQRPKDWTAEGHHCYLSAQTNDEDSMLNRYELAVLAGDVDGQSEYLACAHLPTVLDVLPALSNP